MSEKIQWEVVRVPKHRINLTVPDDVYASLLSKSEQTCIPLSTLCLAFVKSALSEIDGD